MPGDDQQVFISYQRSDAAVARQIRVHLAAAGVTTWMDEFDIAPGSYWPDEIDAGLAGSDIVVGLLSPDAVASRNVKNEWDWAIQNDKRLLLLQVAPCVVPHRYVSINFIDATSDDPAPAFAALLATLGVSVPSATEIAPEPIEHQTAAPARHGPRRGTTRPRAKPLLVGREREQALLGRHLGAAIDGVGGLLLVGGEAGIGKTTLTRWLLADAEERDVIILTGGCYDLTTTPPYGPWVEMFRAWSSDARLPDLPEALRPGGSVTSIGSQAALFELVADRIATASVAQPLVLLLEDLHWTDQASLDLLRYLARLVAGWHVLLVVTYRDDELTRRHSLLQALPALVREADAARLTLTRLDEEAVSTLVEARYPMTEVDRDRLSAYVSRVSEGNPFFAGEVLRALEETGTLVREREHWQVAGLERVQVPSLVRQVIEGRLNHLGAEARRLLEVAAVIGHEVDLDVWVEVSGVGDDALVDVLEQALEAHLVDELPSGTTFRFTHALVRETLYDGLISLRRRGWHRTIGEVLAHRAQPDPDVVASHYRQAADSRAVTWLVRAGERAQLAYAWSTAVERYEAALHLLQAADGDPNERGWLLYRIARLERFRNPRAGVASLDEALRLARETRDQALLAAARFSRGVCAFNAGAVVSGIGDMTTGVDLLENLPLTEQQRLDLGPTAEGVPTITNPRGWLVACLLFAGHLNQAVQMGEAIREGLPPLTALGELGWAHYGDRASGLAYAYAMLGRVDEAGTAFEQAKAMFQHSGHYSTLAAVVMNEVRLFTLTYHTEHVAEQNRLIQANEDLLSGASQDVGGGVGIAHVPVSVLRGHWDVARIDAAHTVETHYHLLAQGMCRHALGVIARAEGATADAWAQVRAVLPEGPAAEPGTQMFETALRMQQLAAELALAAGDLPMAAEWITANERWLDWSEAVLGRSEYQTLLGSYHRQTGNHVAAYAAAAAALAHASDPRQPLALIGAHRLLGELLTDSREYDRANDHLDASLALAEACVAPFERALTLLAAAELRVDQADPEAARTLLMEVRVICEPLDARPTLARVMTLEHEVGSAP